MRKIFLAGLLLAGCQTVPASGDYDWVLLGGRVMDPESGLDAVRNVGLRGGKIVAVSSEALRGRSEIDARGLVVSPGFIDLHSHGDIASVERDLENNARKAADGVTSSLELEVGTGDVDRWYREREGKSAVHFGVSIGHIHVRAEVLGDPPGFLPLPGSRAHSHSASDAQIADIGRKIDRGLRRGAVAVGFGLQYTPGASRYEVIEAFRAAALHGASCHVHMRHNGVREPSSSTVALEEVVAAAAITGAPLHVVHIHSTSVRLTPQNLSLLAAARARGMDVTTECYPYTYGMTNLASGVFDEGWREAIEIDYKDLQWVRTGERLTAETFAKYRKEGGGLVAVHSIPEPAIRAAVAHPLVLVASDGLIENGKGHPRNAGCYARLLGKYVREEKVIDLMEALRKITLMPAQRLEHQAPIFKEKGRIRVGADADVTVFDPARVIDRSTFEEPLRAPEGIRHVLVSGVPVVRDGQVLSGVVPGRALRGPVGD
ncbi:MAG TPA: amidohydrolase family protein [Planctomycetota bacterium]|nr:amidohydrolase family protein [Planctomycetota bacterium]